MITLTSIALIIFLFSLRRVLKIRKEYSDEAIWYARVGLLTHMLFCSTGIYILTILILICITYLP